MDLVGVERVEAFDFEENEWERDKGEDKKEEENVMAIEEVIGFGSGVVEPEGFGEGEIASERGLGFV